MLTSDVFEQRRIKTEDALSHVTCGINIRIDIIAQTIDIAFTLCFAHVYKNLPRTQVSTLIFLISAAHVANNQSPSARLLAVYVKLPVAVRGIAIFRRGQVRRQSNEATTKGLVYREGEES